MSLPESQLSSNVFIVRVIGNVVTVLRNIWALFAVQNLPYLGIGVQSPLDLSIEFLTSFGLVRVSDFIFFALDERPRHVALRGLTLSSVGCLILHGRPRLRLVPAV